MPPADDLPRCTPEQVCGLINHLDLSSVSAVRPDPTSTGQEVDSQCDDANVAVSSTDDHSSTSQDTSPDVGTSTKGQPLSPQYDIIASILKQAFRSKEIESQPKRLARHEYLCGLNKTMLRRR